MSAEDDAADALRWQLASFANRPPEQIAYENAQTDLARHTMFCAPCSQAEREQARPLGGQVGIVVSNYSKPRRCRVGEALQEVVDAADATRRLARPRTVAPSGAPIVDWDPSNPHKGWKIGGPR